MKEKNNFKILVILAILSLIWSSTVSIVSITSGMIRGPPPVVDGVISPDEYADALYVPLTGPWPPEAPFPPSLIDCYVYWDTQYLWIAVDEPVPNWGTASGDNFIEFMWDSGPGRSVLDAWVLWDNGLWSHVICPKWGCWSTTTDPFPGTSWWAVGTATEFKFDYTLYGTSYGDTIKLIIDTSEDAHLYPPFGDCQVWPANPTYYPCETPSTVATWGTIVLNGNQAPTADAGGPYSGLVGESIVLDGSGSSDLDGIIVSYEWDLDDDGIYDDATGSTPTHSWSSEGTYTISLKVTDDGLLTDTDDSTVSIGDHAVDGIISPDEYDGGMAVELVGDSDPMLTIDAYIDWDAQYLYVAVDEPVPNYIEFAFDAGPHRDYWDVFALFADVSTVHQKCQKLSGGWSGDSYVFLAFSDTATEFKVDYTDFDIALGDTIKMCIERGSTTAFWPEGGIIWQATDRRPDPLTWGDVTLSGGPPPDIPPVADANGPYEDTNCDYTINFDGTGSIDPDGTIDQYDWDFDDGTGWHNNIGATPSYTYTNFGEYTTTLRVTDNDGLTDTDTSTAKIYGVNADTGGPYIIPPDVIDYTVEFDGSGSTGYKEPLSYYWEFGDGNSGTGVNPKHTFDGPGIYNVNLTVTESVKGCYNKSMIIVSIYDRDPPTVRLIYPIGGEILKDTIFIRWYAYDSQDGKNLHIHLYYMDEDNKWFKINDYLDNDGEYQWDANDLPDGNYKLLVEAVDSKNNIGRDSSDLFEIKNHEEPPPNNPPNKPTINGKTSGKTGDSYTYYTSTEDIDEDQLYYWFDWNDSTNSGWLGPYDSGLSVSSSHIWSANGTYDIKVKAKDIKGDESPWSDPLSVTMPKVKLFNQIPKILIWLFERFPFLEQFFSHFI